MKSIVVVLADSVASIEESEKTIKQFWDNLPKESNIPFETTLFFNKEVNKTENGISYIKRPINSKEEYSKFMLKELYEYISSDYIFVIQNDSFIYDSNYWDNRFLDYDYIGAPWWYNNKYNVGNGGFSIRSRALMEEMSKDEYPKVHPEDDSICREYREKLESKGFTFADETLASKFAYEPSDYYNIFRHNSFGIHAIRSINLR